MTDKKDGLYIVTHEYGRESGLLPTWADRGELAISFCNHDFTNICRVDVPDVPGAFHLNHILTDKECRQFIKIAEQSGFHFDSPVSLPHEIRHNFNFNWVVSEYIDKTIWQRCEHLIPEQINGRRATGLNARFRFYRYREGDFFKPHTDGAWPGSRVINQQLVSDAYPGTLSEYTFLIFLNDGYTGGKTRFFTGKNIRNHSSNSMGEEYAVGIETSKGSVLCFPHGNHPLHCVHAGEKVTKGVKYIIRTDVLYSQM